MGAKKAKKKLIYEDSDDEEADQQQQPPTSPTKEPEYEPYPGAEVILKNLTKIEYNWIRLYFTRKVGASLGIPAG